MHSVIISDTGMRSSIIPLLVFLSPTQALKLPPGVLLGRRTASLLAAASLTTVLDGSHLGATGVSRRASARLSDYAKDTLNAAGVSVAPEKAAKQVEVQEVNAAEKKLQQLLAKAVSDKESMLGVKFEAEDIAELEIILRNKYCGKQGLFGSMEGGSCEENIISAGYCGDSKRASSSAGCNDGNGRKMLPSIIGG